VKTRLIIGLLLGAGLVLGLALIHPARPSSRPEPAQQQPAVSSEPAAPTAPTRTESVAASHVDLLTRAERPIPQAPPESPRIATNRLERLAQIREQFHALASGDPKIAFAAAKQLTNEVDRETALLTLVTDWTGGELGPPRQRAWAVANYGLEAGLGLELVKNPDLAVLWANEMTEGPARTALLQQIAIEMVDFSPAAAFAMMDQVGPNEAIRSVAPVGIGAAIAKNDDYPIINDLIPGTPADLSGQLHKGDRIVALAQGDSSFVDTKSLSLQDVVQMVRGAPGTLLQLQVIPADAPPGSSPQIISILRDQIKFKR
jgi:PDZ domain